MSTSLVNFEQHYVNARNAVLSLDATEAANELNSALEVVINVMKSYPEGSIDWYTLKAILEAFVPVLKELRTQGITKHIKIVFNTLNVPVEKKTSRKGVSVPDGESLTDEHTRQNEDVPSTTEKRDIVTTEIPTEVPVGGTSIPNEETTTGGLQPIGDEKKTDKTPITSDGGAMDSGDSVSVDGNSVDKTDFEDDTIANSGREVGDRPQFFEDFIGQSKAVARLKQAIEVAKLDGKKCIADKGGILLKGPTGLGKTTLMRIVANELGVKYREFNTASLKRDTKSHGGFEAFIENIVKEGVPVVIGMDEIHAIPPGPETILLTLLEDRVYKKMGNGEDIVLKMPEFTFIGATTDADKLTSAHRGRYKKGIELELVDYTNDEWRKIVVQKFSYYKLQITEGAVSEIVSRSRSSVRDVEGYAREIYEKARIAGITTIETQFVKAHFEDVGIEFNGLNSTDVRVLEALESARDYTLSEENLCSKVNISLGSFQEEVKPFLVRGGFIESYNRGQKLTQKAVQFLKERRETSTAAPKGSSNVPKIESNSGLTTDQDDTEVSSLADGDVQSTNDARDEGVPTDDADRMIKKEHDEAVITDLAVLELLTEKYTNIIVPQSQLCIDLNCSMEELIPIITKLSDERLIRSFAAGIKATIPAYDKLGKPRPE